MKGEGTGYDPDEFTTVSGARVHVLNPNPEAIRLGDIAHGLSRVCRFGGQVGIHMSVAQPRTVVVERHQQSLVPPGQNGKSCRMFTLGISARSLSICTRSARISARKAASRACSRAFLRSLPAFACFFFTQRPPAGAAGPAAR